MPYCPLRVKTELVCLNLPTIPSDTLIYACSRAAKHAHDFTVKKKKSSFFHAFVISRLHAHRKSSVTQHRRRHTYTLLVQFPLFVGLCFTADLQPKSSPARSPPYSCLLLIVLINPSHTKRLFHQNHPGLASS